MKNIAVIYHDADFDGKLSNEVCRHFLKLHHPDASIHSYGWDYGRPVPTPIHKWLDPQMGDQFSNDWALYDAIYIVDLSVDELMAKADLSKKIVWIDHHKSAIEKWDHIGDATKLVGYRIDGVAACRLCWHWFTASLGPYGDPMVYPWDRHLAQKDDFFNRSIVEPRLIRLAGEYDIWDHRDPDAKVLQYGLRAIDKQAFDTVVHYSFCTSGEDIYLNPVIESGRKIKSYCDINNDEYSASYSRTIEWEGLKFCALNIGQRGNSDLLRGGLKPEHDACFAWRFDGERALVSLYHIDGKTHHDLSLIAVKYGGGGHRGACGFRISLVKLAEIIGAK